MKNLLLSKGFFPEALLRPTVNYILRTQLPNGCIPWFAGGKADPWDHIEAAMGLTIGGEFEAAQTAYRWLAQEQLADGSWWAGYTGVKYADEKHPNEKHADEKAPDPNRIDAARSPTGRTGNAGRRCPGQYLASDPSRTCPADY